MLVSYSAVTARLCLLSLGQFALSGCFAFLGRPESHCMFKLYAQVDLKELQLLEGQGQLSFASCSNEGEKAESK